MNFISGYFCSLVLDKTSVNRCGEAEIKPLTRHMKIV